jgi:hypothetical protein
MTPVQQVEIRYIPVLASYLEGQAQLVASLLQRVRELETERDNALQEAVQSRTLVKDAMNGEARRLELLKPERA